jgi:type III secretion system FlhB-like substrate exporter
MKDMVAMNLKADAADLDLASSPDIKRVVGLRYVPEEGLPQVILKGSGPLAEALLERRDRHAGPQVVRNEALLQSLYRLPIDSAIGPDMFRIVAAILAHVFALEHQMRLEKISGDPDD